MYSEFLRACKSHCRCLERRERGVLWGGEAFLRIFLYYLFFMDWSDYACPVSPPWLIIIVWCVRGEVKSICSISFEIARSIKVSVLFWYQLVADWLIKFTRILQALILFLSVTNYWWVAFDSVDWISCNKPRLFEQCSWWTESISTPLLLPLSLLPLDSRARISGRSSDTHQRSSTTAYISRSSPCLYHPALSCAWMHWKLDTFCVLLTPAKVWLAACSGLLYLTQASSKCHKWLFVLRRGLGRCPLRNWELNWLLKAMVWHLHQ